MEEFVACGAGADSRSATAIARAIQEAVMTASEHPLQDDAVAVVLARPQARAAPSAAPPSDCPESRSRRREQDVALTWHNAHERAGAYVAFAGADSGKACSTRRGWALVNRMINPFAVPAALLEELRALTEAVSRLPAIEETIDGRLAELGARLERLPGDIEQAVRPHFERQRRGVEVMEGHLAANREAAEQLPPRIDSLLERIDAMRDELRANREAAEALPSRLDSMSEDLRAIRGEMTSVRETLEPLQGPAERLARMDERLPGGR